MFFRPGLTPYILRAVIKRWGRIVLQLAAGVALVAVLVWQTDLDKAVTIVREGQYVYLAVGLPLYLVAALVNAYRWRLALHHLEVPPVGDLFGIYLVALMLNRVLPMRMGDVWRVQLPARRYGISGEALTAEVWVVETLLDATVFVLLILWSLAFLGVRPVPLTIAWTLSMLTLGGLLAATLAARLELREGWEERGFVRHLLQPVRVRAGVMVPRFVEGLRVLRDLPVAGAALALTLLSWVVQAVMYYSFGLMFGLELSLAEAIVVTIAAAIVVSLPLMPSSIGTYEVAVAGVLVLMGLSNAEAVTYALGSHILTVTISVIAGVVAVAALGLGYRDLPFVGGRSSQPSPPG